MAKKREQETRIEWRVSGKVPLATAIEQMEARASALAAREPVSEMIWLLEHPAVITAGRSAREKHLLHKTALPIVSVERGGQYTYHGEGQRVLYFALELAKHASSIRDFIQQLEAWLSEALSCYGVHLHSDRRKVGLWIENRKLVAFGLRVSRGIITHGAAINIAPDLKAYDSFIPCGLEKERYAITSLLAEGVRVSTKRFDRTLKESCPFLLK